MQLPTSTYTLPDGRILRIVTPTICEAAQFAHLFRDIVVSSLYMTPNVDELGTGVGAAEATIRSAALAHHVVLVGYIEDTMVAIGDLLGSPRAKLRHRATLGMGVHPDYRGQGIGRIVTLALEDAARQMGVRVLELQYIEGNLVARRLYDGLGYTVYGTIPDGVCMPDGEYRNLVLMRKVLA